MKEECREARINYQFPLGSRERNDAVFHFNKCPACWQTEVEPQAAVRAECRVAGRPNPSTDPVYKCEMCEQMFVVSEIEMCDICHPESEMGLALLDSTAINKSFCKRCLTEHIEKSHPRQSP